ncbi:MAG: hypothetical protein ABR529_13975 [Actinomycetota bacterium]
MQAEAGPRRGRRAHLPAQARLAFNVVPLALEEEENGRVQVVVVERVTRDEKEELRIPASVISAPSPSTELARTMDWHIPPEEARTLRDFLYACTVSSVGMPVRRTVLRPLARRRARRAGTDAAVGEVARGRTLRPESGDCRQRGAVGVGRGG